jgi:hypothetical protein
MPIKILITPLKKTTTLKTIALKKKTPLKKKTLKKASIEHH